MRESKSFMAGWLRGFFDGEGTAHFHRLVNGRPHASFHLSVVNTDPALIATCERYLRALGIEHWETNVRRLPGRKPCTMVRVSRKDQIRRFIRLVGFAAPDKARTAQQILDWVDRDRVWDTRALRVVRLWQKGHSARCIARRLGLAAGAHRRVTLLLQRSGHETPKGRYCHPH